MVTPRKPRPWRKHTSDEHAAWIAMWSSGASIRAVARAFGVDHKAVDYVLSALRTPRRVA